MKIQEKNGVLQKLEAEKAKLETEVQNLERELENLNPKPPDESGCEKSEFFETPKSQWTVGSGENVMTYDQFWKDIGIPLANTSYWNGFIEEVNLVTFTVNVGLKITNTKLKPKEYRQLVVGFFLQEWRFIKESISLLEKIYNEGDCKNGEGEYNLGFSPWRIF